MGPYMEGQFRDTRGKAQGESRDRGPYSPTVSRTLLSIPFWKNSVFSVKSLIFASRDMQPRRRDPIGWVCGHVDDCMFDGNTQDMGWQNICKQIQERFRSGEWEMNNFVQCGGSIQRQEDGGFLLTQPDYVNQTHEVFMPKKRWQEWNHQPLHQSVNKSVVS